MFITRLCKTLKLGFSSIRTDLKDKEHFSILYQIGFTVCLVQCFFYTNR